VLSAPKPRLELISHAVVRVAPPEIVGRTPAGERRVVRILQGRLEGRLNGEVLPGGADYQLITPDGVSYLDARYVIRAGNGALILVRNSAVRHGVIGNDPSQYYFRGTPRFETGDEQHSWLNKIIAVCSGARTPDEVILDYYEVL